MSLRAKWPVYLRWCFTLGALGFLATRVDLRQLASLMATVNPSWLAASIALSVGVIALMSARWNLVLRACDLRVPLQDTLQVTFIGQFFNNFLPGATSGDLLKAYAASRWAPDRKAAPSVSIVYDRLTAMLGLTIITALVLATQASLDPMLSRVHQRLIIVAVAALAGGGLLLTVGRRNLAKALAHLANRPRWNFLHRYLRHCRLAPTHVPHFFAAALGVSIPTHLLNVAAAYCVTQAVHLDVTPGQLAVAVAFVHLSCILPVSIGGHGLREAGFLFIFGLYGVLATGPAYERTYQQVLAFSLLFFARSLLSSLPGAVCYLRIKQQALAAPGPELPA